MNHVSRRQKQIRDLSCDPPVALSALIMLTSCHHHRPRELKSVCVSTPVELLISLESRHLRLTHIHILCIKRLFLIREKDLTNTHGRGGSFFCLLSFLFSPFVSFSTVCCFERWSSSMFLKVIRVSCGLCHAVIASMGMIGI